MASYYEEMGLEEQIRKIMLDASKTKFPSVNKMANDAGVDQGSLSKFLRGKSSLRLDMAARVLELIGVDLMLPGSKQMEPQTRDIEFVNSKIINSENGAPPPVPQDYIAVPLALEPVAAGHGRIPTDELRGWIIVWRYHSSIRYLHDLVAVEIGKGQTSMVPYLHPGDIVLIDRADRRPDPDGKIMLTCDPDGGCAIKRVSSRHIDGDTELVFYSDNAQINPPRVVRLNRDYGGNIEAAIGGRVVWAWSDMTRK